MIITYIYIEDGIKDNVYSIVLIVPSAIPCQMNLQTDPLLLLLWIKEGASCWTQTWKVRLNPHEN